MDFSTKALGEIFTVVAEEIVPPLVPPNMHLLGTIQ